MAGLLSPVPGFQLKLNQSIFSAPILGRCVTGGRQGRVTHVPGQGRVTHVPEGSPALIASVPRAWNLLPL